VAMIWVFAVTGLVTLGLMFIHAEKGMSKDPAERRKFIFIMLAGSIVLFLERSIYQLFRP
jgi:hypothetical protein